MLTHNLINEIIIIIDDNDYVGIPVSDNLCVLSILYICTILYIKWIYIEYIYFDTAQSLQNLLLLHIEKK